MCVLDRVSTVRIYGLDLFSISSLCSWKLRYLFCIEETFLRDGYNHQLQIWQLCRPGPGLVPRLCGCVQLPMTVWVSGVILFTTELLCAHGPAAVIMRHLTHCARPAVTFNYPSLWSPNPRTCWAVSPPQQPEYCCKKIHTHQDL